LNIQTCAGEKIVPGFKKLEMLKANAAGNSFNSLSSHPLPSSGVNPLPTANTSVAPPPSNKKVELVVKKALQPSNTKKSYAQASKSNISQKVEDVLQLKEAFPSLSADEVGKILKIKDSGEGNKKPRINMTTRGPLRREVIIPMTKVNAELIINSAHIYISNVNKCLKNTKSDTFADFIRSNTNGITITTNKPASDLDLSKIEKYLKNVENINPDSIESPCLPKSKSYMKIIGLLYSSKSGVLTSDVIEGVLKELHLFKDAILASKPYVIKASPKSNKAVVWVDIWDSQSSSCMKNIINH